MVCPPLGGEKRTHANDQATPSGRPWKWLHVYWSLGVSGDPWVASHHITSHHITRSSVLGLATNFLVHVPVSCSLLLGNAFDDNCLLPHRRPYYSDSIMLWLLYGLTNFYIVWHGRIDVILFVCTQKYKFKIHYYTKLQKGIPTTEWDSFRFQIEKGAKRWCNGFDPLAHRQSQVVSAGHGHGSNPTTSLR